MLIDAFARFALGPAEWLHERVWYFEAKAVEVEWHDGTIAKSTSRDIEKDADRNQVFTRFQLSLCRLITPDSSSSHNSVIEVRNTLGLDGVRKLATTGQQDDLNPFMLQFRYLFSMVDQLRWIHGLVLSEYVSHIKCFRRVYLRWH
jgi:hypothetical protein